MTKNSCHILVDADACPVIVRDALEAMSRKNKGIDVTFISSYKHTLSDEGTSRWLTVDAHREETDMYIANHVEKKDVVITHDIGLAALLIPKDVYVISPKGMAYTVKNIDTLLFFRHISSKARRAGKRVHGPKKYHHEDLRQLMTTLEKILSKEGLL